MHDADQGLDHGAMRLVLQGLLVVFAVQEQVLEQLLEQVHGEDGAVQIGGPAESLLKVAQKRKRICGVQVSREFKH